MSGINLRGETEQSLVEALQQGKQEVLGLLYDAYAPVMMGVITRIVDDEHLAEEVLQETFVAIWSRIGIYDCTRNRFLTWGLAIARGIALEAVKKAKQAPHIIKTETENLKVGADGKGYYLFLKQPLCNLEPEERTILELIYLKGYTCPEAAAKLGITETDLRTSLKKAFIQLKAEKSA
ncbi:RNA polymerase sigma factor [Pontibacter oryzae]|uniref:Sigma-70 family RNA polymerase sigma factor n=1 Tax=Pontibacter oryzae TaxID=2304593 RepID=A0A399RR29_9BACT|nr:sigma-70 family RNA polymerase sigma factor [Pontibacter oryzae]RIJ34300.1 sigma-70 family RNA polymerase sigma factor [Pontibacter oryzae]